MSRVNHVELRYRRADVEAAWTNLSMPPGQQTINLTGFFERGQTYQVEARSVGGNGAASEWVQVSHTVAAVSIPPITPADLGASGTYTGVVLNWTISGTQRADVTYEVQRAEDSSGAPEDEGWSTLTRVSSLYYNDNVSDGITRWYRVRAVDYAGLATDWTAAVSGTNAAIPPPPDPVGP